MAGPIKVGVDWAAIEAGWRAGETMGSLGRRYGVLDLTNPLVRQAISAATDAKSLYEGPASASY
ncbi:hypothetical protein [Neoroseomonas lacus]|uniref:Uncharacterized protein n=1 Tax=Neoroseomonas lacus TaxID=287609 RepID=A0A917KL11_9PROT|nr:hypothetical protein [Neoroseomonas lacus]GGJ13879.1 hypothetical protein GCM10011320_21360 [Neoroseomonas lacus]